MSRQFSTLQFRFQPCPRYPFLGHVFDLELWLVNDSGKLQIRQQQDDIPFTLHLKLDGDHHETNNYDHLFEITDGKPKIQSNGKCFLKIKLLDVSASYGDAKFLFYVKPLLLEHNYIRNGISLPMACIRYRLVVENRTQLPSLWYKDKGGKQNCIEIVIKLSDEKGSAVRLRPIPLQLQLCYSTGEIVNRQNILEISRDSKLQINEDGFTTLRVRINEVSMRHDGKTFSFCVSPDITKDPTSADVSPITCSHVEVRSKITIPKNKRGAEEMETVNSSRASVPISSSSRNLFPSPSPSPIYPHNLNINRYTPTLSSPHPHRHVDEETPLKKMKTVQFHETSPLTPTPSSSTTSSSTTSPSSSSSSELTDDLIQWTMTALETLKQIKWTETGHEKITERTSEGSSIEISRPVFSISNPNHLIEDLLSSYEKLSHTHQQLPPVPSTPPHLPSSTLPSTSITTTTTSTTSSTLNVQNSSQATVQDFSQFENLPPLDDAPFPENSLSWGIVDSFFTGGTG
jgi:hypothetical protein